jgi:elongation of very long chain fatty acids protein 6
MIISDLFFIIPAVIYLPTVFSLKYFIDKQNIDTKKWLNKTLEPYNSVWDLSLSIFSLLGTYHTIQIYLETGYNCNIQNNAFWIELFCMSKVPELLDTIFIVLRSKPLVLLQYYHHLATLLISWVGLKIFPREILIASFMNYFVHTIMYGYYFLYSIGFKQIRKYGFIVTFFQITQMFIAIIFILYTDAKACKENDINISLIYYCSIFMYTSYFYLFGVLLYQKIKIKKD